MISIPVLSPFKNQPRFGNQSVTETVKKAESLADDMSAQGIRARQENLLRFLEKNLAKTLEVMLSPDQYGTAFRESRQRMMQMYERLLTSMSEARPKSDPLDTIERLEKLMKTAGNLEKEPE